MCIIIDTNLASRILGDNPGVDYEPILKWIDSCRGSIVFGGRLARELRVVTTARRRLRTLNQAGKARQISDGAVKEEEDRVIAEGVCRSDDAHVIALARRSGARILCSEDRKLRDDFRDRRLVRAPRGRVYVRAAHARLLGHNNQCMRLRRRSRDAR